jgi:hypothetical protein
VQGSLWVVMDDAGGNTYLFKYEGGNFVTKQDSAVTDVGLCDLSFDVFGYLFATGYDNTVAGNDCNTGTTIYKSDTQVGRFCLRYTVPCRKPFCFEMFLLEAHSMHAVSLPSACMRPTHFPSVQVRIAGGAFNLIGTSFVAQIGVLPLDPVSLTDVFPALAIDAPKLNQLAAGPHSASDNSRGGLAVVFWPAQDDTVRYSANIYAPNLGPSAS